MSKKLKQKKYYIIYIVILLVIILIGSYVYINQFNTSINTEKQTQSDFSIEAVDLLKMQREEWTISIMKIDCWELKQEDSKNYCISQQKMINNLSK